MTPTIPQGKLICVGTGMRMAGQVTPLAQSYLETADVVVSAVPNIFTRKWIQGIAKERCWWTSWRGTTRWTTP